jgi:hypothetical protein
MKRIWALLLIAIISAGAISLLLLQNTIGENGGRAPFHVGVAFQGNTTAEAKLLIDRVKSYTNLFVLGSSPVSRNETATNEVCDYAIAQGLDIIVNFGYYNPNASSPDQLFRRWPWQHTWVETAKQRYGSRFLGVHYDDEPGGVQLDFDWSEFFFKNYSSYFSLPFNTTLHKIYAKLIEANASGSMPDNYDLEATYFINGIRRVISHYAVSKEAQITTFTSDYALYWFDYSGGYDVILAQLGWNHSYVQDIDLVRGAARMQNKQWGAIITWKYDVPPYLASGEEIYNQMLEAYQSGARYVMIFNYPTLEGNDYGIMKDEHFQALEKFWNNRAIPSGRSVPDFGKAEAALVLPKNYGWGMRNPDDRIWGMWGPDYNSPQIWTISRKLLSDYGLRLDIIYDDPAFPFAGKYSKVYFWNESAG